MSWWTCRRSAKLRAGQTASMGSSWCGQTVIVGSAVISETHQVAIYMAGSLETAYQVIRDFCYLNGSCFAITPCKYIYTGGEEDGFQVNLINYPRFPTTARNMQTQAEVLARRLMTAGNQRSCTIVNPEETTFIEQKPPGRREAK